MYLKCIGLNVLKVPRKFDNWWSCPLIKKFGDFFQYVVQIAYSGKLTAEGQDILTTRHSWTGWIIMKFWFSYWPSIGHKCPFKEREFSPGPGYESGFRAPCAGALPSHPDKTPGPHLNVFSLLDTQVWIWFRWQFFSISMRVYNLEAASMKTKFS